MSKNELITMTENEAMVWKRQVGSAANELRRLLAEGFSRKVWIALGFASWNACLVSIGEEFDLSQQRMWQLHGANEIQKALPTRVGKHNGEVIPEGHLRPLTKLNTDDEKREVWQTAVDTAPSGKVTGSHVASVVQEYLHPPKMDVHFSSETDEWSTPQWLFDLLDSEFNFTLDPCALDVSAKCEKYYTPEDDGLCYSWDGEVVFMNPPYGAAIAEWIAKADHESGNGATVVCLIPARTDTKYWWEYVIKHEIRFLKGRLKFGNADNSAPFPSAVVVMRHSSEPKTVWWEVKDVS